MAKRNWDSKTRNAKWAVAPSLSWRLVFKGPAALHMIRAGAGSGNLMYKVLDCIEHADKCQALADETSDPTHKQQCLSLAEMWREAAITRLKWLNNVDLPVPASGFLDVPRPVSTKIH